MWRPPEQYVHTAGVHVPLRIASLLFRRAGLEQYHLTHRGQDPEADAVIAALKLADRRWRASVGVTDTRKPTEATPRSKWLKAAEVADQLGVTAAAVRLACRQERLPAELVDGRWRISREDFEHYRGSRSAA